MRIKIRTSIGDFTVIVQPGESLQEAVIRSLKRRLRAVACHGGWRGTTDNASLYEYSFTKRDGSVVRNNVQVWLQK